jgi:hypothetical protein
VLLSPGTSVLGLQVAICVSQVLSGCLCLPPPPVSYKVISSIGLGTALMTSFQLNYLYKDMFANPVPFGGPGG